MGETGIALEYRIHHKIDRICYAVCAVLGFQPVILLQMLFQQRAEADCVLEVLDVGVSHICGYLLIGENCTKIVSEFISSLCYTHCGILLWWKGNVCWRLHYTSPPDRIPFILADIVSKIFETPNAVVTGLATCFKDYLPNSRLFME